MADNPYQSCRNGFHDYTLNLTSFFTLQMFTEAFNKQFGHPCSILAQSGSYFSTAFFVQFDLTTLLKFYCSSTVGRILKQAGIGPSRHHIEGSKVFKEHFC